MKLRKQFKFWWGWNPGRIEKYLECMAADGWHLTTVECTQMLFGFLPGEPKKTSYCVDFQNKPSAEYLTMIADDGWELVNKSAGWLLWRKDYEGERPEIYTNRQSLIDRNKRLFIALSVTAALQVPILAMLLIDCDYSGHLLVAIMVMAIYLPLFALQLFCMAKIYIANRSLKRPGSNITNTEGASKNRRRL